MPPPPTGGARLLKGGACPPLIRLGAWPPLVARLNLSRECELAKVLPQLYPPMPLPCHEQGKAGGHEPPLFPLPCRILAFFTSGSHEPPLFPLPCHFLVFSLPAALSHCTISPSVRPHLTLPGKTTFLNGIFRAFKVCF